MYHGTMGSGRGGGMGMGAIKRQRQTLSYLQEGKPDVRRTLRRLWKVITPYRWQFIGGTLLLLGGIVLGLLQPLLIRQIIDTAIPTRNMSMVVLLGAGMIVLPILSALLGLAQNYISVLVAQSMIADLREQLYQHIQSLGIDFFTWTRGGEIQSRFLNDAAALQGVLTQSFLGTLSNLITILGALIIMATINWPLALVAALVLPTFAFPVLHFGKRTYEATELTQKALGRLSTLLEETLNLSGVLVIKTFGTERHELKRFRVENQEVRQTQVAQALLGQWAGVVLQGLAAIGPALLYAYGAYLVIHNAIPLGTVVAFAAYLAQLYRPASSLAGANTSILGGLALFDRLFQVLDIEPTVKAAVNPQPLPATTTQGMAFKNVKFHYTDSPDVLHDVSFVAPPGQLTALVGPSGAGKSTLLSLAARLYDPAEGSISLEGIDLRDIANDALRQQIAVVTQEIFLFHTTLRENLLYGAPDATEEELGAAIVAAQLQELVERLPDGLDTTVGERGYRLSGGEKQRVAIARALLRKGPYLLLDEATSSLDSQAERLIQRALETLMRERTVIAIAHRLSTIQRADQILVIEQGHIVERGTHETLLEQSGLYQQLYQAQFNTPTSEKSESNVL
ncbi:multidrug ABC transporter ATP-binding protein [Ktedonobacteria bacterium brp13]|nr:multidrug ABC transporter ATP-binding protein [Ktedonobacteria bacterium brp13]